MEFEGAVTDYDVEQGKILHIAQQPMYKMDDQLHVRFYKHAELNSARSREEGRKIYEDKIYIRIVAPANRLNEIDRQATESDKVRFAAHYQRFIAGLEQMTAGTPISELPRISAAQVLELQALKVDTVEQLSTMPDHTVQLLGLGGMTLKSQAIAFLARSKSVDELAQRSAEQAAEIAELKKLLADRMAGHGETKSLEVKVSAGKAV